MRSTFFTVLIGIAGMVLIYPVYCGGRTKGQQATAGSSATVPSPGNSATVPSPGNSASATADESLVESVADPAQGNGNRPEDRRRRGRFNGRENWNHRGGMTHWNGGKNSPERGDTNGGSRGRPGWRNGNGRETMRGANSMSTGAAGRRGGAVLS